MTSATDRFCAVCGSALDPAADSGGAGRAARRDGRRGSRARLWLLAGGGVIVLVLGLIGSIVIFGGGDEPDSDETFASQIEPSEEMRDFWSTNRVRLEAFDEAATALAKVDPALDPTACAKLGVEFDQVGSVQELSELAANAPAGIYAEALSEQQAAVASAFAACRGEAPVSFAQALNELQVSNSALRRLLDEGGLR